MDIQSKELVLLGASVSAHCFPCFDFHLEQARKLGVCEEDIIEAIRAASTVMNGAGRKMMEKIRTALPELDRESKNVCTGLPEDWKIRLFSRVRI